MAPTTCAARNGSTRSRPLSLGHDARADHGGEQQGGADQFGQNLAKEAMIAH
jgi:hypothetical protein